MTQPENGATITVADGKTLTVSNNANVSGTNTGDQDLSGYVPTSRKVNNQALSSDINITPSQESLTISSDDVTAGWKALSGLCIGSAGAKTHVRLTPIGGPEQQYGKDFTVMNNDANTATIAIWKIDGVVTGIASPSYPTSGMAADIAENDVLQVYYQ
jgi:hypothetical protein